MTLTGSERRQRETRAHKRGYSEMARMDFQGELAFICIAQHPSYLLPYMKIERENKLPLLSLTMSLGTQRVTPGQVLSRSSPSTSWMPTLAAYLTTS
ncbi:hypothetical protein CROQUDRAFT_655256 [Cronartium quercuum f. sp. fusiforme G11]|uniref:Uncharacterized protein n=1 Tax=Cronartium quercuum f. sp. fusiforme G11 TaxID=708437 RepID=A0A9P6NRB3_9BASI|nr:hypothetical protein CROQUDRAFT_655256 [Cronartium quercuum f. sp. fusiforme G11]